MGEIDGGTCWQCGTKREIIIVLEAKLAQYEAVIDAAQVVVDEREKRIGVYEPDIPPDIWNTILTLKEALAALRQTPTPTTQDAE